MVSLNESFNDRKARSYSELKALGEQAWEDVRSIMPEFEKVFGPKSGTELILLLFQEEHGSRIVSGFGQPGHGFLMKYVMRMAMEEHLHLPHDTVDQNLVNFREMVTRQNIMNLNKPIKDKNVYFSDNDLQVTILNALRELDKLRENYLKEKRETRFRTENHFVLSDLYYNSMPTNSADSDTHDFSAELV